MHTTFHTRLSTTLPCILSAVLLCLFRPADLMAQAPGFGVTISSGMQCSTLIEGASDDYITPEITAVTDSYSNTIHTSGASASLSALAKYGLLKASVTATTLGNASSSLADSSQFVMYSDLLTLDDTTVPPGTPEQFLLTATLAYTASHNLGGTELITANANVGVVSTVIATPLPQATLFGSALPTAPGTYTELFNFHAGDVVGLSVGLDEAAGASSFGQSASAAVDGSMTFSFVPVTPNVIYTSALAASVPEPGTIGMVATTLLLFHGGRRNRRKFA